MHYLHAGTFQFASRVRTFRDVGTDTTSLTMYFDVMSINLLVYNWHKSDVPILRNQVPSQMCCAFKSTSDWLDGRQPETEEPHAPSMLACLCVPRLREGFAPLPSVPCGRRKFLHSIHLIWMHMSSHRSWWCRNVGLLCRVKGRIFPKRLLYSHSPSVRFPHIFTFTIIRVTKERYPCNNSPLQF